MGLALREMEEEKQEVAAMDDMVCVFVKRNGSFRFFYFILILFKGLIWGKGFMTEYV